MTTIIFIDNQDSFTYNLVDELEKLDLNVVVFRNTVKQSVIVEKIQSSFKSDSATILFFSPGPGKPSDIPCMNNLLNAYAGKLPILGVCLGHQAIAEHFGGKVGLAGETIHGKASIIECKEHPIFVGLPKALTVARYHSLKATFVPKNLNVIGHFNDMPMAYIDESRRILGFQFHPESILTTHGTKLLEQSINHLIRSEEQ